MIPVNFARGLAVAALMLGTPARSHAGAAPKLVGTLAAHGEWPPARAGDADSVEHLVQALYDVISGPAGKPRDWTRFRSLFLPDARLGVIWVAAAAHADADKADVVFLTPDMYVEHDDPYFKANGFFERGIANRVEAFGGLFHVWSTYESRHEAADAAPFARGVNSIQIVYAQGRYWIASILWDEERPGLTLPPKYLP